MLNLLPKGLPTGKKILFRLYSMLMLHSTMSKRSKYLFEAFGIILRQFTLVSIPIFSGYFIRNYSKTGYLNYALQLVRLDIFLVNKGYSEYFSLFQVIFISINVLVKLMLFIQLLYKKFWFIKLPLQVGKILSWIIYYVLQIPFTLFGIHVLGLLTRQQLAQSEYEYNENQNSQSIQIAVVLLTIVMHANVFCDILLGNKPNFFEKTHTRVHSIVQIHEQIYLLILSTVKVIAATDYFLYVLTSGSFYLALSYYYYLPYISYVYNTINFQTYVSIINASILLIIGKRYENYHILDFNFLFLYLGTYYLSYEAIKKRIAIIKRKTYSPNAYIHELRLRYYLFDNSDSPDERKLKIFEHFKYANKNFFSFSLQYVWESFIVKKYVKNLNLALLKLAKVNTSRYFKIQALTGDTVKDEASYMFRIEAEYLMFVVFDEHIQDGKKISYLELVKYFNYLSYFKDMDHNLIRSLVDFTVRLTRKTSKTYLESELQKIGERIKKYKKTATFIKKKFGMEKEFCKIYGSMLKDILNIEEGVKFLKQINFHSQIDTHLSREMTQFDKSGPMMIVSGCYDSIGTIVYANSALFKLLSVCETSKFIGSSFTELIPPPFDVIHENILLRFLFYRNSTELVREHLFLLDIEKNCIEVVMQFRIAFHKSYPFFIATFKPMLPAKNLILCSLDGTIFSVSEKARLWFPELNGNLFTAIPNIDYYLLKYNYDEIFEYYGNKKKIIMKKSLLSLDNQHLMIIYFLEKNNDDNIKTNQLKIEGYFNTIIDQHELESSKRVVNYDYEEENDANNTYSKIYNALKFAKVLSISVKGIFLLELIIVLAILIITYKLVESLSVNNVILDMGFMRYLSCSILVNTQSLGLINQGFILNNAASFYKESISNSSQELSALLAKYKTVHITVLNIEKTYFKDKNLEIFKYSNGDFKNYDSNLYDAIETFVKYSEIISRVDIENFDKILEQQMFILRNIPSQYLRVLNLTVMESVNDIKIAIEWMFQTMKIVEILCIVPPCVLIIISIVCFIKIEWTSKKIWKTLMDFNPDMLINTRNKLTERLYYIHDYELFSEKMSNHIYQIKYSIFSTKHFVKILFLLVFTLGYFIAISYGPQSLMLFYLKKEIENTNYGGMRRMLTPLTLFWTRDLILKEANFSSYTDIMSNYDISSSSQELEIIKSQCKEIESIIFNFLTELIQKGYEVEDYENLMIGDACKILQVSGCASSLVSKGIDLGFKEYLTTLDYYYAQAVDTGQYYDGIINTEKYSSEVEKSFISAMDIYSGFTSMLVKKINGYMILATFTYIIVLALYYAIFMHRTAREIVTNLDNKVEVLSVFQDEQISKFK